jgi:hypothetical protein
VVASMNEDTISGGVLFLARHQPQHIISWQPVLIPCMV